MNMAEFAVATGDQPLYRTEDIQLGEGALDTKHRLWLPGLNWGGTSLGGPSHCSLPTPDYKNNILKERAGLAHSPLPAKYVDLDNGEWLGGTPPPISQQGPYPTPPTLRTTKEPASPTGSSPLGPQGSRSPWAGLPCISSCDGGA